MVEIQVKLTSATIACQTALLDLINACIQELKLCNTAVSTGKTVIEIKVLKVLLGVERKKIMFDTEKVRSLTCMEKKSSELNYSLSFFSLLQVEDVFFTSFY